MASIFRQVCRLPSASGMMAAATISGYSHLDRSNQTTYCEALPPSNLQRRMTPIGRFAVASETPKYPSIITFFLTLRGEPLSAEDLNKLWQEKKMHSQHPRFHQTVQSNLTFHVEDPRTNHWIETTFPSNKEDIRNRLQHMQVDRWNLNESLWFMNVAKSESKGESMALFRGHHALADGASMIAAFSDFFDESEEIRAEIESKIKDLKLLRKKKGRRTLLGRLWSIWARLVKFIFASMLAVCRQFWLITLHVLWDNNPWKRLKALNKRDKEMVARAVAWSDFAPLDDVKKVAKTLGSAVTVNDVMVACAIAALARQLESHRIVHDELPQQKSVHVAIPVHLKGGIVLPNESVGNNIGACVARVPCECTGTMQRLKAVHDELSSIKRSPVAIVSHVAAVCLSFVSRIIPVHSIFRISNAGSVLVISNNRGPDKPLHVAGREIERMYGFVPLPPEIPVGVVVQSYAGTVSITLSAEPWAVPDGDQFMVWMMEEYKRMALVANAKQS